jgi:rsbT co-antagonist protein RsbR
MNTHRITAALLGLSVVAVSILTILAAVKQDWTNVFIDLAGLLLTISLLIAHVKGFKWSAQLTVIGMTIITIGGVPYASDLNTFGFNILTPVVLAAVLLPWYWSIGIFIFSYTCLAVFLNFEGIIFTPTVAILLTLQAGGIALASVVARTAQRKAEENALNLQHTLDIAEEQKVALAKQAEELQAQNSEQSRLLELVTILEVPIVTIANNVLFAPVVGSLDSRRSQALTSRLLERVNSERARLVILDIAGVTTMDTGMAKALIDSAQAVRLLGCDIIISGIAASIATTITHLKIDLGNIRTARSPQEALEIYKQQLEQSNLRQRVVNAASDKKATSQSLDNNLIPISYEAQ